LEHIDQSSRSKLKENFSVFIDSTKLNEIFKETLKEILLLQPTDPFSFVASRIREKQQVSL